MRIRGGVEAVARLGILTFLSARCSARFPRAQGSSLVSLPLSRAFVPGVEAPFSGVGNCLHAKRPICQLGFVIAVLPG